MERKLRLSAHDLHDLLACGPEAMIASTGPGSKIDDIGEFDHGIIIEDDSITPEQLQECNKMADEFNIILDQIRALDCRLHDLFGTCI